MTSVDPVVLEHHLRGLDGDACAAFVADLWDARGFETERTADVVVASRGSRSVRIGVDCGSRFGRSLSPPADVDVMVTPRGRPSDTPSDSTARVVDAAILAEMLQYAVDRPAAVDLCERHLGAPPTALRPPRRLRIEETLRAVEPTLASTTLLAVVLLVVVGAVAGPGLGIGLGPGVDGDGDDGSQTGTLDSTGASVGTDTTADGDGGDDGTGSASSAAEATVSPAAVSAVPGLGPGGIENLSALAVAHDRALGEQSYTLWLDSYAPRDGYVDAPRVQRDTDIAVDGDRYVLVEEIEGQNGREPVRTVYHDGSEWYVAEWDSGNTTYRLVDENGSTAAIAPRPAVLRRSLVTGFLSTPETVVTDQRGEGDSATYRLVGRGRPEAAKALTIHNYTVVAMVDRNGFVREGTATYTVGHGQQRYTVRFEWTYGRVGSTTVEPQPWFERRVETNGNVTSGGSGA